VAPDTTAFDLLTVAEVAKLQCCSKAHVCNVVAGCLTGCAPIPARLGGRMLLRRESVLSWIEQNDRITISPDRARKGA
jgi:hypothetical protein